MDLAHDQLADGRPFCVLTVADQWSRLRPVLSPALSIRGQDVSIALDQAIGAGTAPRSITVDHGKEFMSRALENWVYRCGVSLNRRCSSNELYPNGANVGLEKV